MEGWKPYELKWSSEILRTKFWAAHQNLTRRRYATHDNYSEEVRKAFAAFVKKAVDRGSITSTVASRATLTPVRKRWLGKRKT